MADIVRWIVSAFLVFTPTLVGAQSEQEGVAEPISDTDLLTQAELENLVAPIALFPDTLLIQILVAATSPMEVVKSDRLLASMDGEEPEVIQAAVEAEEWDESVEVLAVAFPEVIEDMATHIEWTETMGDAMLAQSDEVMVAVQTMRTQAINNGALVSGEEQLVEVTEDETVIIQPADPEVVYVPQYDPQVVYTDSNSNLVGDAIVTGAIAFGTFALIDAIFDDDDDWNDYWGCRNCGGWGGGPIYRNPNIDLDIDGNVNIGNDINIGNGNINRPDDGWKPDDRKKDQARDKIASKKDPGGKTKLPIDKGDSSADALRSKLSQKSGAPDISRPGSQAKTEAVRKTMKDGGTPKVNRAAPNKAVKKPAQKPAVKKPSGTKSHVTKASKPKAVSKPKATHKKSSGQKARSASQRGKASHQKAQRRR
ncbi:DUF3300 domain-containing protein [Ruegeria lacuscaerulensis]|uniref:DUF3300 domain-containing protein n=1 Tax=Ruegeria lacuscaerulensis TaxID=55218 RepID=UPI0014798FAB|nr:DUF3300 domain-containing protein [Ruegeria lacuscaerulensis]